MRSRVLLVASRDRLPRLQWQGGIQARCTNAHTVHLISTAAIPLGGDTIDIRVIVENGARLRLRSAAATVALPGAETDTSHACWEIDVAGELDVDLQPTVVAATARHLSAVTLRLHEEGRVRFKERVQIGRCNEDRGFWSGSIHADRHSQPMLRHRVELGAGSLTDDALAAPRAMTSELRYPATDSTVDASSTVLALASGGTLTTWQADRLTG
ncbi:urease accessory protein UreD [Mycobacterium sp. 23]|uniref:urease accessory protein UreD n=1 Tax=Mycobacterium sp. 23 TaxID=3400424 RepID=UPI003AAACE98